MSRRVLVFTGTRADYGLLRGLIARLAAGGAALGLLVSGAHLSDLYGRTADEIERDGLAPLYRADIGLGDDSPAGVCRVMGRALAAYGEVLDAVRPEILVVLGDRYEAFCAAAAATIAGVPLAHLHGGELTLGAVDDALRHAITKMAQLHFASCETYRRRIIQLGESPDRVWNTGALGVENARNVPLLAAAAIRADLGIPDGRPYLVATYHPVTLDAVPGQAQLGAVLEALEAFPRLVTVFTGANADMGGRAINAVLEARARSDSRLRFFHSLGLVRYLSACRHAAGVLGNSSSGVLEVPSLGVPVLDIGSRQQGRERSRAVLHCAPDAASVRDALAKLLEPASRTAAQTLPNPYDRPGTAAAIAQTILHHPLDGIRHKEFHDVAWN